MKKITEREKAIKRLHEDYRRQQKEKEEEEWIRLQTTGGGAET
tara:strand:- start:1010 stop:1138 length:129 start_codon:yes stop_codon:yes gene_type:complete